MAQIGPVTTQVNQSRSIYIYLLLFALIKKSPKILIPKLKDCIYMEWSMTSQETFSRDVAHTNDLNLNILTF